MIDLYFLVGSFELPPHPDNIDGLLMEFIGVNEQETRENVKASALTFPLTSSAIDDMIMKWR